MHRALPRMFGVAVAALLAPVALAMVGACTDAPSSSTDLHPEGPPMIEQVLMTDMITVAGSDPFERPVFAFGTHPEAPEGDVHPANARRPTETRLPTVVVGLWRGKTLEEIECRPGVDEDELRGFRSATRRTTSPTAPWHTTSWPRPARDRARARSASVRSRVAAPMAWS